MCRLLALCVVLAFAGPAAANAPAAPLPPRLNQFLLANFSGDPDARFAVAWADLNRDGHREAIVRVISPREWCGTGGCLMLVLTPEAHGYREVGRVKITNPPIRLLRTSTNGWRDIGVYARYDYRRGHQAGLRFDGRRYPDSTWSASAAAIEPVHGPILIGHGAKGVPLTR